jgi:hypothetical protein
MAIIPTRSGPHRTAKGSTGTLRSKDRPDQAGTSPPPAFELGSCEVVSRQGPVVAIASSTPCGLKATVQPLKVLLERDFAAHAELVGGHRPLKEVGQLLNIL